MLPGLFVSITPQYESCVNCKDYVGYTSSKKCVPKNTRGVLTRLRHFVTKKLHDIRQEGRVEKNVLQVHRHLSEEPQPVGGGGW